ncbi:AimR family lysis-lysogeny pheromone receptor [Priestia megaterium]|uniref:AimR family lysis-lysogeny pheromone receptor n=1 Tax=Priestia megaterium TaxID=1404 RepID=UPI003CC6CECC
MRATLKSEIKKYTQSEVAEFIGTSSPTITKFLNGTQETSLSTTLELVRYLKPEMEKKMMIHFIKEVKKPLNILIAMEYCSTNRLLKTLDFLLKKHSDTNNHELKEYLNIYELMLKWQVKGENFSVEELSQQVRMIKATSDECHILAKIMEVYFYNYKGKYNLVYDLAKDIQPLINSLDNNFFKCSFSARIAEDMSLMALTLHNDVEQARKLALFVIKSKIGKSFSAYAHYVLGASYFYEDYDKCKMHYTKAIKVYEKYCPSNVSEIEKELEFASAYHNITDYDYKNEVAKAYTSQNAQNGSDLILKDLKVNTLTGLETMLIGMLNEDEKTLMQAFTKFVQEKDMFNANHVKKQLEAMNVDTMILDNLMNLFA